MMIGKYDISCSVIFGQLFELSQDKKEKERMVHLVRHALGSPSMSPILMELTDCFLSLVSFLSLCSPLTALFLTML